MKLKRCFLTGFSTVSFILLTISGFWGCSKSRTNTDFSKDNPDTLLVLAKKLLYTLPDSAFILSKKAEKLAEEQNNPLSLGNAYRAQASYFSDIKMDFESAVEKCNQADSIFRKHSGNDFSLGRGAVLHNLGTIEFRKGNYMPAIEFYTQALHLLDSLKDEKTLPKTLNNLSSLYSFLKDHEKSEQYARDCLKIAKKNKDDYLISVSKTTLAAELINQGKYDEVPQLLDEAKEIALSRKDYYIMDLVYLNYGTYYSFFKKDYVRAIQHLKQASIYADSLQNEYEQMRASINLSETYFFNNQTAESEVEARKSIEWARKWQSKDVEQRALTALAKNNALKNQYKEAYDNQELAYRLRDTVLNESNRQHLNYLEAQFQTEKKELRISSLEKEKKLYAIIMLTGAVSLLLLVISIYLRYKAAKRKKQMAEQKIVQLQHEKQFIATQALLDGETAERSRLARDLHDGLGGMLSAVKLNLFDIKKGALLESGDILRFNNVLKMLDNSIQELRRISHNMMPEALARYGLKIALTDLCHSFSNVNFHYFGTEARLESKLEIMIYRIVSELVNNALRHAEAGEINVQLVQEPSRTSVTVQDNGKGFNTEIETRGMGLKNIQNRVTSFNGTMNVCSKENEGTEINVDFKI